MKTMAFVAGLAGFVVLSGCGGPTVEGKWCLTDASGAHSMMVGKGKMTADTGQTATYTVNGGVMSATQDDGGNKATFSLSADGNALTMDDKDKTTLTRCPA